MKFLPDKIISDAKIREIFEIAMKTVKRLDMMPYIKEGVVVGFSGGADSVMLLLFLNYLKSNHNFPLCAIHVNHGIRGDEAERDMNFSRDFAQSLGVPFHSEICDVPKLAKEAKVGTEEMARNVRYGVFSKFITQNRDLYKTVATAHNSTDNAETVIFNMTRGSGTAGIKGISPIRDNVIRPLIEIPKDIITKALDSAGVPYVTDSTNASVEYTRNFVRHEILPRLRKINPSFEDAITRLSGTIRHDNDYISGISETFLKENLKEGKIELSALSRLHQAVLSRVVKIWLQATSSVSPESIHINEISSHVRENDAFDIDVPGGMRFCCDGRHCFIKKKTEQSEKTDTLRVPLKQGMTFIPELDIAVLISRDKNEVFSSNVYNFSIQQNLGSDIIEKDLFLKTRESGDSYRVRGMTKRLKKLFNDKKIPGSERGRVPIICDSLGIIWVPGFSVRDGCNDDKSDSLWVTIYHKNA